MEMILGLWEECGGVQREIARRLGKDPSSIIRSVQKLKKMGLLEGGGSSLDGAPTKKEKNLAAEGVPGEQARSRPDHNVGVNPKFEVKETSDSMEVWSVGYSVGAVEDATFGQASPGPLRRQHVRYGRATSRAPQSRTTGIAGFRTRANCIVLRAWMKKGRYRWALNETQTPPRRRRP